MELDDAVKLVELRKEYWLFTAISYTDPHKTIFYLCKTRAEADKHMCNYLPIDIELRTIQEQHNEQMAFDDEKFEVKSRSEIIKRGYFFNPFGDDRYHKEYYNGYYSIYAVRPISFGKYTRLSDYDIFKEIRGYDDGINEGSVTGRRNCFR